MSQRLLLVAVRDHLRKQLSYKAEECNVDFDGQPPPVCGEKCIIVHPAEWTSPYIEGLEEYFGIDVTVTLRAGRVPRDRIGEYLLTGAPGESLEKHLRDIIWKLNRNYAVNDAANAGMSGANGFIVALRFMGADRPVPRGPEWFHADPEKANPPVGISQTLHFGEAQRDQTIESQQ